jgi:tripartite-type tricarboxylate transporter receptor subunit TctC
MSLQSRFGRFGFKTLAVLAGACLTQAALAWTDKPVKLLVPAPAGGTMDVIARMLADQLAVDTGQPMVVDNRPGAGGAIAVQALRAAPADGQTVMVTASNVLTEIPHVMKTGFDPLKDVRPVGFIARGSLVMIAAPNVPAKDFKGFMAYAKKNPGNLSFASYSTGTISHYVGMILNQKAGLDLQHVPFFGSPPALAQVMGGQIPVMFDGFATSRTLIASGKVQAYAVASKTRLSQLPDVPTFGELGYPELNFSNWLGVVVSGTLSPELSEKIHKAVKAVAMNPKFKERMLANGFEVAEDANMVQMAQSVKVDFDRNAAIVKQFNIQINQ